MAQVTVYHVSEEPDIKVVSRTAVKPVSVERIGDPVAAILTRGVELRVLPNLWSLRDAVVASTLEFSIIRWRNASAR